MRTARSASMMKTLSFEQIAARIQKEKGFSMKTTPLKPVTTVGCEGIYL